MKTSKITAILLTTTLAFAGFSYAAGNMHHSMMGGQYNNLSGDMVMGMHQGRMGGMGMGMGMMQMNFSQLDLTEQQRKDMQEIIASSQGGNVDMMANMQAHHAGMQALMESETFDENTARMLIDSHHSQMSESRLIMLKTRHQLYQVLSDEQKEQLLNMQQNNMRNMHY